MTAGQVSALVAYQALLALPSFVETGQQARDGALVFQDAGCASCHTPQLRLEDLRFFLADPKLSDPRQGMVLDLPGSGQAPRGLRLGTTGPVLVSLFSDLRRHDVGSELADYRDIPLLEDPLTKVPALGSAEYAALPKVPRSLFVTTRLWGVGSTAPYLHHGHATDLDQAIRAHAGEATDSRRTYEQLEDAARFKLLEFLRSLVIQHASDSDSAASGSSHR
jgi:CxxC motif-containing protein (DUF1111 family)